MHTQHVLLTIITYISPHVKIVFISILQSFAYSDYSKPRRLQLLTRLYHIQLLTMNHTSLRSLVFTTDHISYISYHGPPQPLLLRLLLLFPLIFLFIFPSFLFLSAYICFLRFWLRPLQGKCSLVLLFTMFGSSAQGKGWPSFVKGRSWQSLLTHSLLIYSQNSGNIL